MVDSGFDGFLCLPIEVAVGLGLELVTTIPVELADGTVNENELVFAGKASIPCFCLLEQRPHSRSDRRRKHRTECSFSSAKDYINMLFTVYS